MRRRIKRSSLFTMVAVVALLSLGIGYAAWADTLNINGTVQTGNLNVRWDNASTADNEFSPYDTGTCTASNALNTKNLIVTLSNAYPGYSCTVTASILNDGTVPAEVTVVNISNDGNPELLVSANCVLPGDVIAVGAANAYECTATILVDTTAAQSSTYTASAQVDFTNWSP